MQFFKNILVDCIKLFAVLSSVATLGLAYVAGVTQLPGYAKQRLFKEHNEALSNDNQFITQVNAVKRPQFSN